MAQEKNYVTQEGYDKLVEEYNQLVHVTRKEVIVELQEARAQGDLSENADYDAARERQGQVEARIQELDALIKISEVVTEEQVKEQGDSSVVRFNSTVTIEDLDEKREKVFKIVGSQEADPLQGKLSNSAPLAEAIMNKKVGEICTVKRVEVPYDVKIIKID